jgi:hypothetical protein
MSTATTSNFVSTLISNIDISDSSSFIEPDAPLEPVVYAGIISFKANINALFADVRMPARYDTATDSTSTAFNYDFEGSAASTLRGLFRSKLLDWLQAPYGDAATIQSVYIEQVKERLRRLFDNVDLVTDAGLLPIGMSLTNGVVRLKQNVCEDFVSNALPVTVGLETTDTRQTLGAQTFTASQLVQLCEASARDAGRYQTKASDNGFPVGQPPHYLKLAEGDSWTVRVRVSAKGSKAPPALTSSYGD